MVKRIRLDQLLVERGWVEARERARAKILAGEVFSGERRLEKPGMFVPWEIPIEVKGRWPSYVSFGGVKLEQALRHFEIDPTDKVVLDVGASTGGFTDCLLSKGAKKVYAYDVGYGQLDARLRTDRRVVVMERRNVRYLKPDEIGEPLDLACVDVSFISLRLVLPPIARCLRPSGRIIALVKPQFEVGRSDVGKRGIVEDPQKRGEAVHKLRSFFAEKGWSFLGECEAPAKSRRSNREIFVLLGVGG